MPAMPSDSAIPPFPLLGHGSLPAELLDQDSQVIATGAACRTEAGTVYFLVDRKEIPDTELQRGVTLRTASGAQFLGQVTKCCEDQLPLGRHVHFEGR
jgi:hypothetical protein